MQTGRHAGVHGFWVGRLGAATLRPAQEPLQLSLSL